MSYETIWITGARGRVGTALIRELSKNTAYKIIGTDVDVDITDIDEVERMVQLYRPNAIINCAAITDKEFCESDMVTAFKVNALGARNMAIAARGANCKLIHLSTDDVFDGRKSGRWNEFDAPDPKSVYARSKYAGEQYVRNLCVKHLIVRSSWVYGGETANDYFAECVKYGEANEVFYAPVDFVSAPTSIDEYVKVICKVIDSVEYGTIHAACEGMCTRNEFAQFVLAVMGYNVGLAKGSFRDKEPSSTLLENLMLKMTELHEMPHWQEDLKAYADKLKAEA